MERDNILIAELKERIALLEETQSVNNIGHWEFCIESNKLTWSDMVYDIHELPQNTDINKAQGINFYHPDYREIVSKAAENCIVNAEPFNFECKLITHKKNEKWVRATGRKMGDKLIGSFQDITDLKNQELKFKGIFNSTFAFIGFLNTDGVLLEANDTAVNMAGIQHSDVIGKYFWDCYWWQISEQAQEALKVSFQKTLSGETVEYEVAVWIANKTPITILFTLKPIFDENGKVIYIIPEGRPVQELVDARRRYKSVLEGTNVGTWEWNVQTGETIFNERWADIVGYTLEELAPISIETWMNLAHPVDLEESGKRLTACFEKKSEFYEFEARMKHKDGHWVWVYDRGKVFEWTDDGKPLWMYGTHQDITERKQNEEALRISEEAFRGHFENAAVGMAIISPRGQWLKVNRKVCEIVGYPEEELRQLTFQDITHPDDLDLDLSLLSELVEGKRDYYQMEKRYFHKDGHIVYIILAVSMVRDENGNVLHFISQIVDISKRKIQEQEIRSLLSITEEQNDRLKNFAHIVSHNLRSHSGGISGLLDLFQLEHPEFEHNEFIKLLKSGSENLKQTVEDLSEIVRVYLVSEKFQTIGISEIIKKNISTLASQISKSGIKIINEIPEAIQIKGIHAYIDSIILNFITNAIKYKSEKRESFLKIYYEEDESTISLFFEDNGLGIDLKKHGDKLFGMYKTFHHHDDSRGVGLFITKNQVESMGGKIAVDSKVNVGTTFKITFKK